jgi:hypothetical protein
MAGPTLRAMLNPRLLSATAPGSSERGTMSPTEACHAGALKAAPQPIRNVSDNNSQGVITPVHAQAASTTDMSNMNACADSMTWRRSKLSATAPASRDSSMIGSATAACTSATISAACVSEIISQEAPTDWISPPRFDSMLDAHTARNIG